MQSEIATLRSTNVDKVSGSLSQTASDSEYIIEMIQGLAGSTSCIDPQEKSFHRVIQPQYEKCLTDLEMSFLEEVYKAVYPQNSSLHLCRFCKEFKTLVVNGEEYVSVKSRSQRSVAIVAHWPSINGGIDTMGGQYKVGLIESFIRHQIKMANSSKHTNTLLAQVKWLIDRPKRDNFHKSVIGCGILFQPESSSTFIPVSRIMGRCTTLKTDFQFEYGVDCVTIAIPTVYTSVGFL